MMMAAVDDDTTSRRRSGSVGDVNTTLGSSGANGTR